MKIDPTVALGELLGSALHDAEAINGDQTNFGYLQLARQCGIWINELTGKSLGFGEGCLTDRVQIMNLSPPEDGFSWGGMTKLLPTSDGLISLPLARDDDRTMLPALFEREFSASTNENSNALWAEVAEEVLARRTVDLRDQAITLGMPLAIVGEVKRPTVSSPAAVVTKIPNQDESLNRVPVVVELASMWAGPLVGKILRAAGMRVIKVESVLRPDGTRAGSMEFFHYLNDGKEIFNVDFSTGMGVAALEELINTADVVIEGSRPRALAQLGIVVSEILANTPQKVWLSITGYGRDGENSNRVAFGDDAAAAGGLCNVRCNPPRFIGDALADPLTGLLGAVAVLSAIKNQSDCSYLIDLAMARVAALCV